MAPRLALLLSLAALLATPAAAFVRVSGTRFVTEDCNEFAFVGANTLSPFAALITSDGRPGRAEEKSRVGRGQVQALPQSPPPPPPLTQRCQSAASARVQSGSQRRPLPALQPPACPRLPCPDSPLPVRRWRMLEAQSGQTGVKVRGAGGRALGWALGLGRVKVPAPALLCRLRAHPGSHSQPLHSTRGRPLLNTCRRPPPG